MKALLGGKAKRKQIAVENMQSLHYNGIHASHQAFFQLSDPDQRKGPPAAPLSCFVE